MKTKLIQATAGSILVLAAAALPLQAAANLSDWKIGKVQVGEEVDKKDLEGKVVVIEYWGTR